MVTAIDGPKNKVFDATATVALPIYHNVTRYVGQFGKGSKTLRAEDGVELAVDPGAIKTHGLD